MLKLASKVCLLLFVALSSAYAQTTAVDSAKVKKQYNPWLTYSSFRVEKLFTKGSSLFAEYSTLLDFQGVNKITQGEYNSLNENYSSFLWLGYEQAFTEHWYGGISEKVNIVKEGYGSLFTRLNVAHRGHISKLFFYKEFAFEYLSYNKDNSGGARRPVEGRISPSIGLGYRWKFGKQSLYVGVNYRFFVNFGIQEKSVLYDKRKIDRTKLKAEISYHFLPHWNIGAYYLRDTQYYYTLATYNGSGGVITPDYKLNNISEGVGFVLTYLLFKDNSDKYVTDLPVR
ncbi:MAG: hypothetical protein JWO58_2044 [Chitinophagaceae bacterium]|nr:hypothetical protein [Chitinophagaceae bacterium]